MKTYKCLVSLVGLLLIVSSGVITAQNIMKIDTALEASSTRLTVNKKGNGVKGKYQFGPYKIISGKSGWSSPVVSKTGLISGDVKTKSKDKKSFVFVANDKDTVMANISVSSYVEIAEQNPFLLRMFFDWSEHSLKEAKETYISSFSPASGNTVWNLIMVYPIEVEVEGQYEVDQTTRFKGVISNGTTEIEIKKISQLEKLEKTKKVLTIPMPIPIVINGYELFFNGHSVAAVQLGPQIGNTDNLYVWIHNELEDNLKVVAATSLAALMVKN